MLEHPAAPTTSLQEPHGADAAIGRLLSGRYELQALLGSGASAHVYLAGDRSLGRQVAVKCLRSGLNSDERFRRRFRAEAQAAAQLSHPNLLAVFDWGEDPNAYLVTELLMGGTLLDLLAQTPRLSPSQGLLIALQAAQGLQYAHAFGIVHRDIKPANLLFGEEGRLRIADFGIARAVAEAAWTEPEGVLVGTARYAAPEQALGDAIGDKTDVYSLALTVIEAVTGRVPLLRENALATMVLRQDRDVVEIEELGALGPALLPAGRADPESRPSASELIEALTEAARNLPRPERLPLVSPVDLSRRAAFPSRPSMDSRPRAVGAIDLADTGDYDPPADAHQDTDIDHHADIGHDAAVGTAHDAGTDHHADIGQDAAVGAAHDAGTDQDADIGHDAAVGADADIYHDVAVGHHDADHKYAPADGEAEPSPDGRVLDPGPHGSHDPEAMSAETSPMDPAYHAPSFIDTVHDETDHGPAGDTAHDRAGDDGLIGDGPGIDIGLDVTSSYDRAADQADVRGYGLPVTEAAAARDEGVFLEETEAVPLEEEPVAETEADDGPVAPLPMSGLRRSGGFGTTGPGAHSPDSLEVRPIDRPSPTRRSSKVRTKVSGEMPTVAAGQRAVSPAPDTVRDIDLPLEEVLGRPGLRGPSEPPGHRRSGTTDDVEAATALDDHPVITRFDLPPTDGSTGPTIDVRDEARGRFGNTGPHVVVDGAASPQGTGAGFAGPSGGLSDADDDFSLGDGFDDLTIGELVVVDPDGVDGPPVGRALPAGAIDLSQPEDDVDDDAHQPSDMAVARPDPYPDYGRRQSTMEEISRNDAFHTAFIEEPAVGGADGVDRGLLRRWGGPALAGLLALMIVGAAIAMLLTSGVLSTDPATETSEATAVAVGDYVGLTVPEARVEAEANGWNLTVSERREDGSEAGVITRQLPAAGETLAEGRTLVVEVSLGPELRSVPRVVGLTVDEAAAVLQRSGLQMGVVTERHDDQVGVGRVLTARVAGADAADQVETGTPVDLVVSAGPEAVAMPSFVGLTLEAARAQADELGLVVTQAEASSEIYDEGFIVDTTPPTNTPVMAGDQLTLVVSTGAPFVVVPNVVGLTPVEAAEMLTQTGFNVSDTDGPPNQPVVGTSPEAGASHRKGDDVVIRTAAP